jgi:hypothetical protein
MEALIQRARGMSLNVGTCLGESPHVSVAPIKNDGIIYETWHIAAVSPIIVKFSAHTFGASRFRRLRAVPGCPSMSFAPAPGRRAL